MKTTNVLQIANLTVVTIACGTIFWAVGGVFDRLDKYTTAIEKIDEYREDINELNIKLNLTLDKFDSILQKMPDSAKETSKSFIDGIRKSLNEDSEND